ncbi:MAG: hypothetical protein VB835_02795, partial [Pirellulales bacterium]
VARVPVIVEVAVRVDPRTADPVPALVPAIVVAKDKRLVLLRVAPAQVVVADPVADQAVRPIVARVPVIVEVAVRVDPRTADPALIPALVAVKDIKLGLPRARAARPRTMAHAKIIAMVDTTKVRKDNTVKAHKDNTTKARKDNTAEAKIMTVTTVRAAVTKGKRQPQSTPSPISPNAVSSRRRWSGFRPVQSTNVLHILVFYPEGASASPSCLALDLSGRMSC